MRAMTELPRRVAIACAFIVGCSISTELADSRPMVRLIGGDIARASDLADVLPDWALCQRGHECLSSGALAFEQRDTAQTSGQARVERGAPERKTPRLVVPGAEQLVWPIAKSVERTVIDTRI